MRRRTEDGAPEAGAPCRAKLQHREPGVGSGSGARHDGAGKGGRGTKEGGNHAYGQGLAG